MRKSKVVADTNFLIDVLKFRVNFIEEYRNLFVTESILNELKFISSGKSKVGKYAKLALDMIKSGKIKALPKIKNKADEDLIEYAKKGFLIATNDRELRKRLKSLGFKTIYLRSRKKIAVG